VRKLYGILGWPVWHSRSPAMHTAAFEASGVDAAYVPFGVPPSRLPEAVAGLAALGVGGVNVTLPHKAAILPLLDRVEPGARAIGAVNVVVREGRKLTGTNTDAPGLVRALGDAGFEPKGADVTVIGAGGAARAAVVGLGRAGAAHIGVAARRPEAAERLVAELAGAVGAAGLTAAALDSKDCRSLFRRAALLVQATTATMDDGPDASRFAASLPLDLLPEGAVVTDVVYVPRETAVLRAANRRGLTIVDGSGMLLHQGALAFERWTGRTAPLEVMRAAL
jgi:shikimate dehydrogenase